ncbi:hypothetical protein LA080_008463 [Diaporthe eres]|nr:hypothetical protein LA080_008463 [Diaporthe eres]
MVGIPNIFLELCTCQAKRVVARARSTAVGDRSRRVRLVTSLSSLPCSTPPPSSNSKHETHAVQPSLAHQLAPPLPPMVAWCNRSPHDYPREASIEATPVLGPAFAHVMGQPLTRVHPFLHGKFDWKSRPLDLGIGSSEVEQTSWLWSY